MSNITRRKNKKGRHACMGKIIEFGMQSKGLRQNHGDGDERTSYRRNHPNRGTVYEKEYPLDPRVRWGVSYYRRTPP